MTAQENIRKKFQAILETALAINTLPEFHFSNADYQYNREKLLEQIESGFSELSKKFDSADILSVYESDINEKTTVSFRKVLVDTLTTNNAMTLFQNFERAVVLKKIEQQTLEPDNSNKTTKPQYDPIKTQELQQLLSLPLTTFRIPTYVKLINDGADPNAAGAKGTTTLHAIAYNERTKSNRPTYNKFAQRLVNDYGVDINQYDNEGHPPFYYLISDNFATESVLHWATLGADINILNDNGLNTLTILATNKLDDNPAAIITLVNNHKAKDNGGKALTQLLTYKEKSGYILSKSATYPRISTEVVDAAIALVEAGASISISDSLGLSSLAKLALDKNVAVPRLLKLVELYDQRKVNIPSPELLKLAEKLRDQIHKDSPNYLKLLAYNADIIKGPVEGTFYGINDIHYAPPGHPSLLKAILTSDKITTTFKFQFLSNPKTLNQQSTNSQTILDVLFGEYLAAYSTWFHTPPLNVPWVLNRSMDTYSYLILELLKKEAPFNKLKLADSQNVPAWFEALNTMLANLADCNQKIKKVFEDSPAIAKPLQEKLNTIQNTTGDGKNNDQILLLTIDTIKQLQQELTVLNTDIMVAEQKLEKIQAANRSLQIILSSKTSFDTNDTKEVMDLVRQGANPNLVNPNNLTLLNLLGKAVRLHALDIAELVFEHGADVDCPENVTSPLQELMNQVTPSSDHILFWLRLGTNPETRNEKTYAETILIRLLEMADVNSLDVNIVAAIDLLVNIRKVDTSKIPRYHSYRLAIILDEAKELPSYESQAKAIQEDLESFPKHFQTVIAELEAEGFAKGTSTLLSNKLQRDIFNELKNANDRLNRAINLKNPADSITTLLSARRKYAECVTSCIQNDVLAVLDTCKESYRKLLPNNQQLTITHSKTQAAFTKVKNAKTAIEQLKTNLYTASINFKDLSPLLEAFNAVKPFNAALKDTEKELREALYEAQMIIPNEIEKINKEVDIYKDQLTKQCSECLREAPPSDGKLTVINKLNALTSMLHVLRSFKIPSMSIKGLEDLITYKEKTFTSLKNLKVEQLVIDADAAFEQHTAKQKEADRALEQFAQEQETSIEQKSAQQQLNHQYNELCSQFQTKHDETNLLLISYVKNKACEREMAGWQKELNGFVLPKVENTAAITAADIDAINQVVIKLTDFTLKVATAADFDRQIKAQYKILEAVHKEIPGLLVQAKTYEIQEDFIRTWERNFNAVKLSSFANLQATAQSLATIKEEVRLANELKQSIKDAIGFYENNEKTSAKVSNVTPILATNNPRVATTTIFDDVIEDIKTPAPQPVVVTQPKVSIQPAVAATITDAVVEQKVSSEIPVEQPKPAVKKTVELDPNIVNLFSNTDDNSDDDWLGINKKPEQTTKVNTEKKLPETEIQTSTNFDDWFKPAPKTNTASNKAVQSPVVVQEDPKPSQNNEFKPTVNIAVQPAVQKPGPTSEVIKTEPKVSETPAGSNTTFTTVKSTTVEPKAEAKPKDTKKLAPKPEPKAPEVFVNTTNTTATITVEPKPEVKPEPKKSEPKNKNTKKQPASKETSEPVANKVITDVPAPVPVPTSSSPAFAEVLKQIQDFYNGVVPNAPTTPAQTTQNDEPVSNAVPAPNKKSKKTKKQSEKSVAQKPEIVTTRPITTNTLTNTSQTYAHKELKPNKAIAKGLLVPLYSLTQINELENEGCDPGLIMALKTAIYINKIAHITNRLSDARFTYEGIITDAQHKALEDLLTNLNKFFKWTNRIAMDSSYNLILENNNTAIRFNMKLYANTLHEQFLPQIKDTFKTTFGYTEDSKPSGRWERFKFWLSSFFSGNKVDYKKTPKTLYCEIVREAEQCFEELKLTGSYKYKPVRAAAQQTEVGNAKQYTTVLQPDNGVQETGNTAAKIPTVGLVK